VTRARQSRLAGALAVGLLPFAAPVVWIAFQQGVGAMSYLQCRAAAPTLGGMIGIGATLACAAAATGCWLRRKHETEAQQFLMLIGAGSAAIFGMAAMTMTVALVMVPACAR
jgi:hypothetical protein